MIGNGENIHHPIFIDDLLEGLSSAATIEEAAGKIFVLAGKEFVTTNDMVKVIAEELNRSIPKFRVPFFPLLMLATIIEKTLRPIGIQPPLHRRRMDFFRKSFVFSQEKSYKTLGFVSNFTFREGILETARWYAEMEYL